MCMITPKDGHLFRFISHAIRVSLQSYTICLVFPSIPPRKFGYVSHYLCEINNLREKRSVEICVNL